MYLNLTYLNLTCLNLIYPNLTYFNQTKTNLSYANLAYPNLTQLNRYRLFDRITNNVLFKLVSCSFEMLFDQNSHSSKYNPTLNFLSNDVL